MKKRKIGLLDVDFFYRDAYLQIIELINSGSDINVIDENGNTIFDKFMYFFKHECNHDISIEKLTLIFELIVSSGINVKPRLFMEIYRGGGRWNKLFKKHMNRRRESCLKAIRLTKFYLNPILKKDVTHMISKMIYETRFDGMWII